MCLALKISSEMVEFRVGFIIPACFLAVQHDKETIAPNVSTIQLSRRTLPMITSSSSGEKTHIYLTLNPPQCKKE